MTARLDARGVRRLVRLVLGAAASMALAACARPGAGPTRLPTLDGRPPLVIAHRGASGYLPEETIEAYTRAIELGADAIEMDLVVTKDGVLITRHDPNLAFSTDVATRPEFASRRRTMQVDGETQTGWFCQDFTLAEIETLRAIATDAERPHELDGRYRIPTFQQVLDLAAAQSKATGRAIAIYPETKNPTFFRDVGLPMEDTLIAMLDRAGLNGRTAPVWVQSSEPSSLEYMKGKGLKTKLVQLIDGGGVDLRTGAVTEEPPFGRPYDWTKAGDERSFDVMVTPAGLAEIARYADGIGPWKRYIIGVKGSIGADGQPVDRNHDGRIDDADATSTAPTTLVADAHAAGLFVHPFTFRNESRSLASDYEGDAKDEYLAYYRLGVDGVFTDFADTALAARRVYLEEVGR